MLGKGEGLGSEFSIELTKTVGPIGGELRHVFLYVPVVNQAALSFTLLEHYHLTHITIILPITF